MSANTYEAFGLTISSPLRLPGMASRNGGGPRVSVQLGSVQRGLSGTGTELERLHTSEGEIRVFRGSSGDLVLDAGELAACHVSADGSEVTCQTRDPDRPQFMRLLLDTVLGTAALCRGYEGLHAAAVLDRSDRLVAIMGSQGGGKSTLVAELIVRGGSLFADDLVFLDGELAHPGPAVMSLPSAERRVGRTVAELGAERWVEVERPRLAARPLWLVVLLERTDAAPAIACLPESSPVPLLAAALDSGLEPERRRRRFEVVAAVARRAHVVRLLAPPTATPQELAEALEAAGRELADHSDAAGQELR